MLSDVMTTPLLIASNCPSENSHSTNRSGLKSVVSPPPDSCEISDKVNLTGLPIDGAEGATHPNWALENSSG